MIWTLKKKNVRMHSSIFVYGIGGGMGNVSKIVGDFLIRQFKAEKIYTLYSDAMPDEVFTNKKGVLDTFKINLYRFRHRNRNFVVISGILQPIDPLGRYEMTHKVLSIASKLNCKLLVSLGGYGVEIEPEDPKIYIAGNKKELVEEYLKKYKNYLETYDNRNIVGMSGLISTLAKLYKIDSIILLAETYPTNQLYGYGAAKKILELFSKMFNFKYDLEDLSKKAKEMREAILDQNKQNIFGRQIQSPEKKRDIYYFG